MHPRRRPSPLPLLAVMLALAGAATLRPLRGVAIADDAPASGGAAKGETARASGDSFHGQDRFDQVATLDELRDLERSVVELTDRVRPSVVFLKTRSGGAVATGTAVVIGKDGLLATCGHVGRRPGREVTATLADGTELRGKTLGQVFHDAIDCGLVQLETEGRELPALPLGTTDGLAEGDWVLALGYTQGLGETIRPPLLRVGRVLFVNEKELYIDAAIDAGDSGGPSINLRGEVVGLNARCGKESWQNVATRIDLLTERLDELKEKREAADQPETADKERRRSPSLRFPANDGDGRDAVERAAPLATIGSAAAAATVRVRCGESPVAFGTIVRVKEGAPEGIVATKASLLVPGAAIEVELADGRRFPARERAREPSVDVALLTVERGEATLPAVPWADDVTVETGSVLVTPRGFGRAPTFGFAAIEERESVADQLEGPFLGVQTRSANPRELAKAAADQGVIILRVVEGTAAERAGLRPGLLVLSVNDVEVGSPVQLRATLKKHAPGETVRIRYVRGEAADEVAVVLGERDASRPDGRRGNTATPISRRSSGFGSLLPHDAVTAPDEMGGPVVDLAGRVIGLNIARFDRTATHAIPAARMAEVCERLLHDQPVSAP